MSTSAQPIDYFAINTTKIYSANPAGNFTVTSLPLTSRHLHDIESPSHYNLLFDLVASSFSKIPLHRRPLQQVSPFSEASTRRPRLHQRTLCTTKCAEPILTPQRHEQQQQSQAEPKTTTSQSIKIAADAAGARPSRPRSCNRPCESQSQIEARPTGAPLTLSEHDHHHQSRDMPRRPSRTWLRPAEEVSPSHNIILNSSHQPRLNSSRSADPILRPRSTCAQQRTRDHRRPPQSMSGPVLNSTSADPSRVMAPERPHSLNLDGCGPFPTIGSARRQTTAQPPKRSFFSFLHPKKAANVFHRTHEDRHEVRRHQRHERAAEKMAKENADVAWRAGQEQKERMQNIKKLEKATEMKGQRMEEHVAKMQIRRHQKEMGGVSCGYDPWAGTMPRATRGRARDGGHSDVSDGVAGQDGEDEESDSHRVQRGTTWGISSGTPGRTGGYYGSDGSAG